MNDKKICLITFSNNADHQNVVYSMFNALYQKHNVYTIGIVEPKTNIAPHTENNFYVRCPKRPGVTKGTFNIKVLFEIRKILKKNKIDIVYFESQHLWNMFVMMLCPKMIKVVAVHDVIPHDGNKFMTLSNYVTCHMAKHVVLRNNQQKSLLATKYKLPEDKITCFELWRDYPEWRPLSNSKVFLCFGRIRKYKGFDLFEQIIEKTPTVQYRIVGEADEESKHLIEKVNHFSNVSLLDREVSDEEMQEEFRNADWIVLPYSSATQSGVIADACRYSRPVISFDVGTINEQIQDNKTGFLVKAGDVETFAEAVEKANNLSNAEMFEYAKNAYEYGKEKYSAELKATRFYDLLQGIH